MFSQRCTHFRSLQKRFTNDKLFLQVRDWISELDCVDYNSSNKKITFEDSEIPLAINSITLLTKKVTYNALTNYNKPHTHRKWKMRSKINSRQNAESTERVTHSFYINLRRNTRSFIFILYTGYDTVPLDHLPGTFIFQI